MDAAAQKRALRAACRQRALELPAEYRRQGSEKIARAVLASAAYAQAQTLFVYVSLPTEPCTLALIDRALQDGKRVCVPRCRVRPEMDAVLIHSRADLAPDAMGIPVDNVGVKATTTEHLGFEGREEGISATAVCLLARCKGDK